MDEAKPAAPRGPGPPAASEYAELSALVRSAGLFRRRPVHYLIRGSAALLAFAGAWVLLALAGAGWWQLGTAVLLAVAYTQLSFLGHDAGHKQIFRGRRANDAVGTGLAGLVGLSYGWWVGKHNRHHANPNLEDSDPDIDIPALAFSTGQSRGKAGFLRWMAKYQAFLFFPLLLLEGIDLHWSGIKAVWHGGIKSRRLDAVLLTGHLAAYLAAVFLLLPPGIAVVFIAVHHAAWGVYMGCSFAPNHKAMPHLEQGHRLDFLRRQVLTSHNVRGGRWMTYALGGLNYQIEHHLFPNIPMATLRRAQPLVRDFCRARGISYSQGGLLRTYADVLRHLHQVGSPAAGGTGRRGRFPMIAARSKETAARVTMKQAGSERGHVDGGWWPRSADLAAELPALAAALEEWVGPVASVAYHLDTWDPAARKVRLGDRTVRLEGFRQTDRDTVMVLGTDSRRVSLLVVPGEVSGGPARAALRAAADGDSTATAAEILSAAGTP